MFFLFRYLTTNRNNHSEPINQRYDQDSKVLVEQRRTEPGVENVSTEDILETVRGCLAYVSF